uniref:O1-conotoxin peptide Fla-16 n=1 Tax=Conus flavidus TaxID=101302 RepID=U3L072_CONFL|nr:O1-conotoxin peptide precursor Fla-16 [Conus flavidus]
MKLTCILIVAVLFSTAWTFVTVDDSINHLKYREWTDFKPWGKRIPEARDKMKNLKFSKLDNKKRRL